MTTFTREGHFHVKARMQETLTFPTVGSPHHRFAFSQACYTDYSERCSPISTPFVSAPSSPGRHGFYFSAPTSPHWAHTSKFMASEGAVRDYPSAIPLYWEDKPGTPRRSCESKSKGSGKDDAGSLLMNSDFEFSARFAELDDPSMSPTPMSSANELFCNGQIKPLKLPPRLEQPPYFANHIVINEHAFTAQTRAFEFNNRAPLMVASSASSLSAPQSPRFSSTLSCIKGGSSTCGISEPNRGRSAACSSSLSAPQSPRSPLNRVKEAICGVSSRIEKAFDSSLGTAVEGSRDPMEGSRGPMEGFRSSMASMTHVIQATGHRRTRSFSPLRIFQRENRPPPSSKHFEAEEGKLSRDSSVSEKKQEEEFNCGAQKSSRKWTLKDLLHRKSGGENRSNSSRASSRRSSASSMDSTLSREKQNAKSTITGRSSSESSHSSSSSHSFIKDSIAIGNRTTRTHMGDYINNNITINSIHGGKAKTPMGDTINNNSNNNNNNNNNNGKPKTFSQRGTKAPSQKPNKGSVSPHELHYMMHKAQSEELRKKTFLPYRQGLLGCLGFTSRSYRTVTTISKTLQSVSG